MSRGKSALYIVGVFAIALLLGRLPDGILRSTQSFLYVAALVIFVTVTAAMILLPARRFLVELFALPLRVPEGVFGLPQPDEATLVARPLLYAVVCVVAAIVAGIVH